MWRLPGNASIRMTVYDEPGHGDTSAGDEHPTKLGSPDGALARHHVRISSEVVVVDNDERTGL